MGQDANHKEYLSYLCYKMLDQKRNELKVQIYVNFQIFNWLLIKRGKKLIYGAKGLWAFWPINIAHWGGGGVLM